MGKGKKKTASGEVVELRTSYEVQEKLEEFYTGGQVQVSTDGEYMFTCCGSAVKALHVNSGVVEHSFREEEDLVICFVLSPDSNVLVVSWRSQQLKQYQWSQTEDSEGEREARESGEREKGRCVRSWRPLQGAVVAMAIDSTSTLLATGSSSGIKVWDCAQHYCTHNLRPSGGLVGLLTFHPDPAHLTLFSSTASDTTVKVWDLQVGKCVAVLRGHVSAVTSVSFSGDRNLMISAGRDQVLHVWNLTDNSLYKTLPVFEAVEGVVVLPVRGGELVGEDKKSLLVATAGDKGVIRVWDLLKGKLHHSLEPLPRPQNGDPQRTRDDDEEEDGEEEETPQVYTDLLLSESRGEMIGVTYDHNIIFYDLITFKKQKQLLGYCDEILDMQFLGTGDSARMAVVTNSEHIKIFSHGTLDCQVLHGHSRVVLSLDSYCLPPPLPPLLVTSSKDHTLHVWGEENERSEFVCKGVGSGHTEAVGAVALGRLSGSFAVSGSQDCTLKLWSLKSLSKWKQGDPPVKLPTKYTQLAHDKDINSVDVSPNDKLIATGSQDKTAKLWRVSDGGVVGVMRGHRRGIWSVKFSPVDQCVLTASADTTLKLWAVSDCSCIKTFEGHTMSVLKAIFLTRGMQIASSGSDGLVKIWTVKTNECVTTLDQHTEKVWSLASSGDGRWLASGGADSLICLWKDVTEKVEAEKQEAKERQILQEQELSNYLQQKDYVRAVGVAITLDQPFRVYTILSEVLDEGGADGVFKETLNALQPDQIHSILKYLTKWNTNAKYSTVAQTVLFHILNSHTPEQLVSFGSLHSILEGLIPYTERHFQRLSRLLQLSMFVDYTWQCMKLPDQSSHELESQQKGVGQAPAVKNKTLSDGSDVISGRNDVIVAAADSTTHDEGPLFVEDHDPDPTLHLEHTTHDELVHDGAEDSETGSEEEVETDNEGSCDSVNGRDFKNLKVEGGSEGGTGDTAQDEDSREKGFAKVKKVKRIARRKVAVWRLGRHALESREDKVSRYTVRKSRVKHRPNRVLQRLRLSAASI